MKGQVVQGHLQELSCW